MRVRTTTRNPAIRLLFMVVALLLRNLWVWQRCALAEPRRGERRPRLDRLQLRATLT